MWTLLIRKTELRADEATRNSAPEMKAAKTLFTEENPGRLAELGGDLREHANTAIEEYISRRQDQRIDNDTCKK